MSGDIKQHRSFSFTVRQPHQTSQAVNFVDSAWCFDFYSDDRLFLLDLQRVSRARPCRPFQVTCFVRDEEVPDEFGIGFNGFQGDVRRCTIWSAPKDSAVKIQRDLARGGAIQFLIILSEEAESVFGLKSTKDKCISTFSDASLECLSSDFGNLLTSGDSADVQLRCQDVTRPAHRSVLTARSEVFSAMFRNKMAESTSGIVDISDLDASLLDSFLKYIYTGKMSEIPEDRIHEMYAVADKYAVHVFKKACSDWMVENLTRDNYLEFLTIADFHSDEPLKDALIASITDHPEWLNSETWFEFQEQNSKLANAVYRKLYNKTCFKEEL